MKDCVFCKIINGDLPCYKIYEDEFSLAFLDIADDFVGHTLVIPKRHYTNILDIPAKELSHIVLVTQKIAKHYVEDCGYNGVNILNASEKCAEQSVFHLHFHIIPRKNNDGIKIWPDTLKKNQDFKSICENLTLTK